MGFVLSFFKNFGHNIFLTKIVSLNFSRIGRCTICVLILGFSHPKMVKNTNNPVADDKNCKIFSRHVQEPTTLNSNQDTWFITKPKPLSLTQSENYFFGASFDKILSNNNKFYLFKFPNFLGVSKPPQTICTVSKKSKFSA